MGERERERPRRGVGGDDDSPYITSSLAPVTHRRGREGEREKRPVLALQNRLFFFVVWKKKTAHLFPYFRFKKLKNVVFFSLPFAQVLLRQEHPDQDPGEALRLQVRLPRADAGLQGAAVAHAVGHQAGGAVRHPGALPHAGAGRGTSVDVRVRRGRGALPFPVGGVGDLRQHSSPAAAATAELQAPFFVLDFVLTPASPSSASDPDGPAASAAGVSFPPPTAATTTTAASFPLLHSIATGNGVHGQLRQRRRRLHLARARFPLLLRRGRGRRGGRVGGRRLKPAHHQHLLGGLRLLRVGPASSPARRRSWGMEQPGTAAAAAAATAATAAVVEVLLHPAGLRRAGPPQPGAGGMRGRVGRRVGGGRHPRRRGQDRQLQRRRPSGGGGGDRDRDRDGGVAPRPNQEQLGAGRHVLPHGRQ